MSEKKPTLNDLFNKAGKKKAAPKAPKAETVSNAAVDGDAELKALAKDPKPAAKKPTDYESSDEEKPDLILKNDDALLLDKKEAEAKRTKQQQPDSAAGWRALDQAASDKPAASLNQEPNTRGPPRGVVGQKSGAIDFKSASSLKFTNKKKKIDEEFPELGQEQQAKNQQRSANEPVSKKDTVDMDIFNRSTPAASTNPAEEKKEAPKMPMFTSSKKKRLDVGDQVDAIQSSKQNYDFSSMQTSAATSKVYKKDQAQDGQANDEEAKQRKQEEKPRARFQRNFGDDDEFTTVTEKKRGDNKRGF